jgi:methylmalonyl-CoA/ethylmalonyl-CoA epimerase
MQGVEHIGIAVRDLRSSIALYERLLGKKCYKQETVSGEKVTAAFFQTGDVKIELLEASAPESPVAHYVARFGEGIHHIAFAVDDIHAEMRRLAAEGFSLLNDTPKAGADNKWVCFLQPKETGGVLIELCMERR